MKQTHPKVRLSVVVPVFNEPDRLRICLDSILSQVVTFDFEILIVNDASTDRTRATIGEYQGRHPGQIRVLDNERNLGNGRSYALALRSTQADYVHVLDADDYWTDEYKLQRQFDFLEANREFSMVAHNTLCKNTLTGEESLIVTGGRLSRDTFDYRDILIGNVYFHTSSILFRHVFRGDVPGCLDEVLGSGDEIRLRLHGSRGLLRYMNEVSSVYVYSGAGIWSSLSREEQIRKQLRQRRFWVRIVPWRQRFYAWLGVINFRARSERALGRLSSRRSVLHRILGALFRTLFLTLAAVAMPGRARSRIGRALRTQD